MSRPTISNFDASQLPTIDASDFAVELEELASPAIAQAEAEMKAMPHLQADRRLELPSMERSFLDAQKIDQAAASIQRVPGPTEALHLVVCGKFALWDVVPAILRITSPATIDSLRIATLGFSKTNVAELCQLLDAGRIRRVRLLASHYFKGTSRPIYQYAAEELAKRPAAAEFLSLRTHAKILLLQLSDGRTVTVEASANLRSCSNIEQVTLCGSPDLYTFHCRWIDDLFAAAKGAGHAEPC